MGLDLTRLVDRPRGNPLDLGVPTETQKEVLQHFKDGKRIVLMVAGRQSGKALGIDTPVPTPSGWTSMGELEVGDVVYGADGSPVNVIEVSDVMYGREVYEVEFSSGETVIADADHQWFTRDKEERKRHKRGRVRTTRDIYERVTIPASNGRFEYNHYVPLAGPVEGVDQDLPMDPYVLGAWLGDGSCGQPHITQGNDEVVRKIESRGYPLRKLSAAYLYSFAPATTRRGNKGHPVDGEFTTTLKHLGVYYDKHIPEMYLRASVEQRRQLYDGLMDTDGYVAESGAAEITFRDLRLAHGMRELVASLGFKPGPVRYRPKVNAYRFAWHELRARDRAIVRVSPVSSVPVRCIEVDAEDSLFLFGEGFIPTHNSHLGARWLILQTMNPHAKDKLAFAIAPTYQMARVIERKIQEVLKLDPALWKKVEYRAGPPPTYTFPNGWVIEVRSADNPDSLRGPTISAVWFDEVAAADEYAFDVIMPTLLANDGAFLGTTTPRGVTNWIYDRIYVKSIPPGKAGHDEVAYNEGYATVTGSTWANVENLNPEAIKMLEDQYGKDSAFGRQEIAGEFVSYEGLVYRWDAHNSLAPMDLPQKEEFSQIIGGIDFGWTDPAAAYVLGYKDGVWYVIDGFYGSHIEPNDFALRLATLHENHGVINWYADSARPELIADLNSRGLPVLGVKKPRVEDRIREMAMFADNNRLKISTACPDVIREITSYKWPTRPRRDSTGAVKPVDENDHSLDAIGYAIYSMRWLWRNDVDVSSRVRSGSERDVDIEDVQFQEWKRRNNLGRRRRGYGPAGRMGR